LPGWRIPTVTELYSLVRTGGGVTLLDPAFPSSPPDLLWSSTIRPGSCPAEECGSPMFYCVDFDSGKVVDRGAGERICGYRCVRTVDE
jgi:hypothetical protein